MLFKGEGDAIKTLLAIGLKYGYGNCIAWLKRAWADHMEEMGWSPEAAKLAADAAAYERGWTIDKAIEQDANGR